MISQIQRIYNQLKDEQSKYIFLQRVLFSISKDRKYINDMVNQEIQRYKEADQMYNLINWIKEQPGRNIVFGGGFAGYQIIQVLKNRNIPVYAICDNNSSLWGTERHGVKVISPKELVGITDRNVIIGVNSGAQEIKTQLNNMGIIQGVFMPQKEWWLGKYNQYFDLDIVKFSEQEVFMDGGALDGQDTIRFLDLCSESACAYLFEPDIENFKKTKEKFQSYNDVRVIQRGLWDCEETLKFNSGEKENSAISEDGNIEIETAAIDDIETKAPITFIKMDIEGSESKALDGARKAIMQHKPKLAICVYHKPEDIIELPLKILEMNPEYKLYLRHYSYTDTETVLYAI